MQDKFIVPVASMLVGLAVWVAFVIVRAIVRRKAQWSARTEVGMSLAAGGIIVFSAFT